MLTMFDTKVQCMFCIKGVFQCQKLHLKWIETRKVFHKKIMAICNCPAFTTTNDTFCMYFQKEANYIKGLSFLTQI